MPVKKENGDIDYQNFKVTLLNTLQPCKTHIYLERAMPMAMGAKHAFNYGRGFAAIEIAIQELKIPVTYIEPRKWQKEMFQGIDSRLKPKEQSLIAVERLFPQYLDSIPKRPKGKYHDGAVDALLIAEYGRRVSKD